MREHRPKYSELTEYQRRQSICRAYTNVLIRYGKLVRLPCERCGGKAEARHEDYSKPREVRWLCRPCWRVLYMPGVGKSPQEKKLAGGLAT